MLAASDAASTDTSPTPRHVQVFVEFRRIGEIDTMNEKYQAEFVIEAKWTMADLGGDYNPHIDWNPQIYIENVLNEPKESLSYEVLRYGSCSGDDTSSLNATGNSLFVSVVERRVVKGYFWEKLELKNFPFDIQELSITLASRLTKKECRLVCDAQRRYEVSVPTTRTFQDQQKWKLFRYVKVSEYASYDLSDSSLNNNIVDDTLTSRTQHGANIALDSNNQTLLTHDKMVVSCFCARKPEYYLANAFLLIFLITASSLTVFSIAYNLPANRLQTTYTLLLTSISFKWVVNRSLPTVSYLTSLDHYAIISIVYLCLLCVWHALVAKFGSTDIDLWGLAGFSLAFVLYHCLFVVQFYMVHKNFRRLARKERRLLASIASATSPPNDNNNNNNNAKTTVTNEKTTMLPHELRI